MNGDNRRTGAPNGAPNGASNGVSNSSPNGSSPDSAPNGASKPSSFAPSTSSRANPFATAPGPTNNAMANPGFNPHAPPLRLPAASQSTHPLPTAFATSAPPATVSAIIRRLPSDVSVKDLRAMLTFSEDLDDVQLQRPSQPEDAGFLSAFLTFSSLAGAQEVQNKLHGKRNLSGTAELIVELPVGSPASSGRGFSNDIPAPVALSTSASSSASSASSLRQVPRYTGPSQTLEEALSLSLNGMTGMASMNGMNGMAGLNNGMNGMYGGDLLSSENGHYPPNMFSPQSPIGNHLRPGISGKALIKNDTADDDEATQLLSDLHPPRDSSSSTFADNNPPTQQRRSTAPHIPINGMASLSLATNMTGPSSSMPPAYGHPGLGTYSAMGRAQVGDMSSPIMMNGPGSAHNFNPHHRGGSSYPAVNPADQNPPCNTLYVGNLPVDTNEEELKTLFSKQRGYKRLCFRTKGNGPMCFVEFEDISFATKALNELYGAPLHNSTKGGIRLSFSKNPLGVRSNQNPPQNGVGHMAGSNGMVSGSANVFAAANGPPPGLRVPPGFRQAYPGPSPNSAGPATYGNGNFPGHSNGVWNSGYNANAPNPNMPNANGYNAGPFDANGYPPNGYTTNGYVLNGQNLTGLNQNLYHINGDNPDEEDSNEDDQDGQSQNRYRRNGQNLNGKTQNGKPVNSNSFNGNGGPRVLNSAYLSR